MGWNPTRSVRARLVAAFLVLGLVPLLLVSIVAYRSAEASLIEGAGQRLEDVAFNAIDKLDRNLFERYGDVQAYALSAPARSMEQERLSTWIEAGTLAYFARIDVHDDPSCGTGDDWTRIDVRRDLANFVVASFESSSDGADASIVHHHDNGLNGKVSCVRIDAP